MELKDVMTTEAISSRFRSQFDLVNYAIALGTRMIRGGQFSDTRFGTQNVAQVVLNDILNGDDVAEDQEIDIEEEFVIIDEAGDSNVDFDDEDEDDDEEADEESSKTTKKKGKAKKAAKVAKGA